MYKAVSHWRGYFFLNSQDLMDIVFFEYGVCEAAVLMEFEVKAESSQWLPKQLTDLNQWRVTPFTCL